MNEKENKEDPNLSHVGGNLAKKRRRNALIKATNEPATALLPGAPIRFRMGSAGKLGWINVSMPCKPSSGGPGCSRCKILTLGEWVESDGSRRKPHDKLCPWASWRMCI